MSFCSEPEKDHSTLASKAWFELRGAGSLYFNMGVQKLARFVHSKYGDAPRERPRRGARLVIDGSGWLHHLLRASAAPAAAAASLEPTPAEAGGAGAGSLADDDVDVGGGGGGTRSDLGGDYARLDDAVERAVRALRDERGFELEVRHMSHT